MEIKNLATYEQYTFKSVACKMSIAKKITSKSGRIELADKYSFNFVSKEEVYKFSILDKSDSKLIRDYIEEQGFYNLAYVENIESVKDESEENVNEEKRVFFLHIAFFYKLYDENYLNLDLKLSMDLIKKLKDKKLIKSDNDNKKIKENFILSDGSDEYLAVTIGNYHKNQDEDSENLKQKIENKAAIKIYGENYSFQVHIDEKSNMLIVDSIDFRRRYVPNLALIRYSSKISDENTILRNEVIEKKTESRYLKIWEHYSSKEGEFLLKRAREIGDLKKFQKNIIIDNDEMIIKFDEECKDNLSLIKVGDYLIFSKELPAYMNCGIDWEYYKELFVDKKDNLNIKANSALIEVLDIDLSNCILRATHLNSKDDYKHITLSILGDQVQIIRRETARNLIKNAECANPKYTFIIGGEIEVSNNVLNPNIYKKKKTKFNESLSSFVKNKIFKNEPTQTQRDAIAMALNTPDIAIIQGPPGTGKTTVITAIIERLNELADKNISNKGQVLVTSFQHDAVKNVIERLSINSLPTIKFGTKKEGDLSMHDSIYKWSMDIANELKRKNPNLNETYEQIQLHKLYEIYISDPSDENAIAFLKFAKKNNFDEDINDEIDALMEEFSRYNQEDFDRLLKYIRRIRTTRAGFLDDGPETADELLIEIEDIINVKNSDNKFIVDTLYKAADILMKSAVSDKLLDDLAKCRMMLLDKCIPKPIYEPKKIKKEIIEIYERIKLSLKNPKNELDEILFNLYNELENNSYSLIKAIEDIYAS